ncbi:MAG TPA: monovalent cation/H(+) antiporter subunit G [Methanospirillum sp.]|uniref:monovalent cation/H(+) antiporter subunit G n=1 Tax=Methanospirillum sp. TaxID=45200 RepID=UPI002C43731D|nr:monovalent cation/H(+) antiporter subunit G [Methanospirillum sp.]HOJ96618.1 monovalent cation/H(+) antiporter subunit G [Methanospirillum sp.]HOL41415.1 monovalent cation/H(+) antiporter subunit G [Methanospirillum sp.]HPP77631.1 monovalent cation/H(+) antiporter subunit G [Methanospirillum sp.]
MIADTIIYIFLAIGLLFNALGVIGLLRFPDVYTRLHASTKATTFGSIFLCLAVVVFAISQYLGSSEVQYLMVITHTIIAVCALAITNAAGSHAIARAAHRSGQKPKPAVVDRLSEAGL